jgi:hypothetical protein
MIEKIVRIKDFSAGEETLSLTMSRAGVTRPLKGKITEKGQQKYFIVKGKNGRCLSFGSGTIVHFNWNCFELL